MIGMAIAGGAALAGQVVGGILGSKAARRRKRMLEAQKRENQQWYDRRYNEDATQRADAQAMLTRVEDSIMKRNKASAGSAAIMGGDGGEVAAQTKEANNEALAATASQIVANGEARKDSIEQQYMARKEQLEGAISDEESRKTEQLGAAVQQGLSSVGNIVGGIMQ